MMSFANESGIVRLRGLPWSAGKDEVANFLSGCDVVDVHFTFTRDGRPSGEAYVELGGEQDVSVALSRNQEHMGKRYIEVFESKRAEMEFVLQKDGNCNSNSGSNDGVVRLRGLPFSCTHDDICTFFKGLQIVANGIALLADELGRASGEAYVQFASQAIADVALQKHKEKMGLRYVEIFKSSMLEAESAIALQGKFHPGMSASGRPTPYDRMQGRGGRGARGGMSRGGRGAGNVKGLMAHMSSGYGAYGSYGGADDYGNGYGTYSSMVDTGYGAYGSRVGRGASRGAALSVVSGMRGRGRGGGMAAAVKQEFQTTTGHSVHMRGLPFAATEADIIQFFSPLNPVSVVVQYNADGRPSGEADVDFATHIDAQAAMNKDKAMMERRYIELFLSSAGDLNAYGVM